MSNLKKAVINLKRKKIKTHFTLETRLFIEEELNKGTNISTIAKLLNRDNSNIAREILRNRSILMPTSFGGTSCCIHKDVCKNRQIDCDKTCKKFELENCEILKASPHVCNSCPNKRCRKAKYYYKAKEANSQYKKNLVESRSKLHYTTLELEVLNNDFYCLVKNTRSIYHSLCVINSAGYNFNIKSIYRQIKDDKLRLKPSDLPRVKRNVKNNKIDKSYKRNITGHTYEDYLSTIKENPEIIEWQMDCVQGIQGANEPVFLTLQIVEIKFLFIFILNKHTNNEVIKKLVTFNEILKSDKSNKSIELLLTDNGHEFINLEKLIETIENKHIYYCHPYSSFEKGSIENNHELLRRIIPQGVSLSAYNEDDIKLICSHINSLFRKELDGKCPFDLINNYLSSETLKILGYSKINASEVKLIPELLGEKNVLNIKKYLSTNDINKSNIKFIKDYNFNERGNQ